MFLPVLYFILPHGMNRSFSPLTCWLYRLGFCRFACTRYKVHSRNDLANQGMHLTNVAVQKKRNIPRAATLWDIQDLKEFLHHKFTGNRKRVDDAFGQIQQIIFCSLQSVAEDMIHDVNSFELFGFDVLLDEDLRPWLLEVNASPSLSANNDYDYQLKYQLVTDVLDVIDMEGTRSGYETNIGGFDLLQHDGKTMLELDSVQKYGCSSYIGAQLDA